MSNYEHPRPDGPATLPAKEPTSLRLPKSFGHGLLYPIVNVENHEGYITPPAREPTPLRLAPKSLRPYVRALLTFKSGHEFQSKPSVHLTRRLGEIQKDEGDFAAAALKVWSTPSLLPICID